MFRCKGLVAKAINFQYLYETYSHQAVTAWVWETMWWAGRSPQCNCASRTEDSNVGSSRTQQRWSQGKGWRAGTQRRKTLAAGGICKDLGGTWKEKQFSPPQERAKSISGTAHHECGCWEAKAPTTAVEKGVWPKGVQRGDAGCENHSAAGEDCVRQVNKPLTHLWIAGRCPIQVGFEKYLSVCDLHWRNCTPCSPRSKRYTLVLLRPLTSATIKQNRTKPMSHVPAFPRDQEILQLIPTTPQNTVPKRHTL